MNQIKRIKATLNKCIKTVCQAPGEYCRNPEKDFTRRKKLPMGKVIKTILGFNSKSLNNEIIDPLLQSVNKLQADRTSCRHRTTSTRYGGNARPTDGRTAGRDRSPESSRSNGMGAEDEQHLQRCKGNRLQ